MIRFLCTWLRSRALAYLHDLAWVPVSVALAFLLRFNFGEIPPGTQSGMLWMLGVTAPVFAVTFWFFGLYRAVWRFVSFPDLIRLIKAVTVGVLVTSLALFVLQRLEGVPRSIAVLFPMLLIAGLAAPRLLYRWLRESHLGLERVERKQALIVGAGQLGEQLIRHLLRNGHYLPVAVVDLDPRLTGKEIHGVRVLGDLSAAERILASYPIQTVILAAPEATPGEVNQLVRLCVDARIPCQAVPFRRVGEGAIIEDFKLRPIMIEDLLRREVIVLDRREIADHLHDKRVLVTGGGGSIGSELCHQVAAQAPASLIVLECSEYNLYQIEQNLRAKFPSLALHTLLGDVKHPESVETLFRRFSPELVFHAAAYKHVPLLESNPLEAAQNNVFGTRLVAEAAHRHGSSRFVLVSTDKAVNPTSVMGATKRVAEVYCQNLNARSGTKFITTRFGNVLGSVGSVVPLFEAQIAAGGPVTVTHPEICRYFMTIPEAVSLILQASAMGRGGEIYVMDMGEPVKIVALAEQMIRLAGLTPYDEIPIVFTSLRPGEKLCEELFHEGEALSATDSPKILLAGQRQVEWSWLENALAELAAVVQQGRRDEVAPLLRRIVPEFRATRHEPGERPEPLHSPKLRVVT